ncbi:hypothetical protein UY3_11596 [Chelonia mydas]|uniref:Uncharacterized protein n=1 Tax=Chelonia mydas TaxID=8469 RepID=M7B0B8_CHEMY|nr:hypothetical protein UY3_11596 [Chelonia mydas]
MEIKNKNIIDQDDMDARCRTGSHLLVLLVAGDVFDVDVPGPLDGVRDHEALHELCVVSTNPTGGFFMKDWIVVVGTESVGAPGRELPRRQPHWARQEEAGSRGFGGVGGSSTPQVEGKSMPMILVPGKPASSATN